LDYAEYVLGKWRTMARSRELKNHRGKIRKIKNQNEKIKIKVSLRDNMYYMIYALTKA